MTYTVIDEKGPTSWGAYVPDLPGVITVRRFTRGTWNVSSKKRSTFIMKVCVRKASKFRLRQASRV